MSNTFKKSMAEFIGTFALVFCGCGAIVVSDRLAVDPVPVPLVFGLVVAVMIYALGHISGAHFNPAVTLAFFVTRHFPKEQILAYWGGQFLGGIFALLCLWALVPTGVEYGATIPQILLWKAFVWEVLLSFILMFVIIAVATDTRAVGTMAGAAIGGTVALCAYFGGPVTGASMNPARSFAPAVFQGELGQLWIYFLGPVLGMVLAAIVYEKIRCDSDGSSAQGCC